MSWDCTKRRARLRQAGRPLVYLAAVIYLLMLYDNISSIESEISSMQSDCQRGLERVTYIRCGEAGLRPSVISRCCCSSIPRSRPASIPSASQSVSNANSSLPRREFIQCRTS